MLNMKLSYSAYAILLVMIWLFLRLVMRSGRKYPPGPRGLPIIGNLLDWPWESGWLKFTEWAQRYGDIVHVQILGSHIVVLNRIEVAKELLNRSTYSDRPVLTMLGELMGFAPSMILAPYGNHWKGMRRLTGRCLTNQAIKDMLPSIVADSRKLVCLLLEMPAEFRTSIRFILGKNFIENTYGLDVDSHDNIFITLSRDTHEFIEHAAVPGNYLVDAFPFLKYLPTWAPGAGFKRYAELARQKGIEMVNKPFDETRRLISEGVLKEAIVPKLLHQPVDLDVTTNEYEYALKWAAGSLYGAGTESTASTLITFIMMMAKHPDIQTKAQAEIDGVTKGKRLPEVEDLDNFPYVQACMKETLRFHPPTPLGVAHRLSSDDVYKGYDLPRGSIIIANLWGMSRDPQYYKKPSIFRPERFLTDGQTPELDPDVNVFGFGRRACQGLHYAKAVLFFHMASILAAFNISAKNDEGAHEIVPSFTGGFVSHPESFPCRLCPRSRDIEKLLSANTFE